MSVDIFSAKNLTSEVHLEPTSTAIAVIDMVNEFCKPGGVMVLPGYEKLVAPQRALIAAGRKVGTPIIFIKDTHRANMRREREFQKRIPHCLEGTWGAEIIEDLKPETGDIYITKRRYSGFFNTDLDLTLKDLQINTLIVTGVVTNICVRSTVHDAFFLGYEVIVPEDCVAATGPREQQSSLYDIATHFGTVTDSKELIAGLLHRQPVHNREIAA